MNIWESTVLTDKGAALQSKMVNGQTLHITKVMTGGAKVPVVNLRRQTSVTDGGREITLQPVRVEGDQMIVPVLLENTGLEEGYTLCQVGIYAQDPDEGEILYCLAQASEAKHIPSAAEGPGFSITWDFCFKTSNTVPFEVDLNSKGLVSIEQYQVHTGEIHSLNDTVGELGGRIEELNADFATFNPYIEGIEYMNIRKIAGETNPDKVINQTGTWTKMGSSETEGYFNVAMGWINIQFSVNTWKVQMRMKYGNNNWSPWKTIYSSI